MAKERDWVREAETAKARGEKMVGAKLSKQLLEDFEAKCIAEGLPKNAVLKKLILEYTYGEKAND